MSLCCLSLESVSAKVLLCVLHSTVSHPSLTPTTSTISNKTSQILTRNPFPQKPMKTSKSRHTSAAGPFKGTFAPVFFFFYSLLFPQYFLLCSMWCNCSDFLLFSLSLHRPSTARFIPEVFPGFLNSLSPDPPSPFLTLLHGPTLLLYPPLRCNLAT